METMKAFAMGQANRGKEMMVFDWDKAAKIIKEVGAKSAQAGLSEDWEWTGGPILKDGQPVKEEDTYVYLCSTWAHPVLMIDGESFPCHCMESDAPNWNKQSYWPDAARAILNA